MIIWLHPVVKCFANSLLFFGISFLLFGCQARTADHIKAKIDVHEWNSSTLSFLQDHCSLVTLNQEQTPELQLEGKYFNSLRDQITYMIDSRISFDSILNRIDIPLGDSELRVIELYDKTPIYIFQSTDGDFYSIEFDGYKSSDRPAIELTQSYDDWFASNDCVNTLKSPFCQGIWITNSIKMNNAGEVSYNCINITIF